MRYLALATGLVLLLLGVYGFDKPPGILDIRGPRMGFGETERHLQEVASLLREYERAHGHYPSNSEGLFPIAEMVWPPGKSTGHSLMPIHIIRLDADGSPTLVSLWGEPLIYENRRGLPEGRFAGSMVDRERDREYSVRVDDGIYVWCLAAGKLDQIYRHRLWLRPRIRALMIGGGILLILVYFVAIARSARRAWRESRDDGIFRSILGGLGVCAAVYFFILMPMFATTCYKMGIMHRPNLPADYKALITRYRDQGVISDAAYHKLLDAANSNPRLR